MGMSEEATGEGGGWEHLALYSPWTCGINEGGRTKKAIFVLWRLHLRNCLISLKTNSPRHHSWCLCLHHVCSHMCASSRRDWAVLR